ncbi:HEAT repeat domain-containing protein [Pseudochryseolinea flava]|uniref:HEAT repeat domain-containing protein n=1 Tax=Pseudochryseolinea flava TaxID=2059302 RepID=A0A364XUX9_9BACT|nr:HEAT repeat domain-containing protein [Pseudochryseolinea flava]RAV97767.1 hypothetical protein DQQ10_26715 [Pseudochryseolinea flava]
MEKEKLESLLIDYIDGNISAADKALVEAELLSNPEAVKLHRQLTEVIGMMNESTAYEPSQKLKSSFDAMLANEKKTSSTKVVFFSPAFYRIAAAVTLLVVGGGLGYFISKYNQQQSELAEAKRLLQETKQEMMAKLDNEHSASQRLLGVTVAIKKIEKADREILGALIKTMNDDPNTNVRVAALEALGKFHQDPMVRRALIDALSTQKDPIVQIALIRILVEMNEKGSLQELEKITNDEEMLKEVKDEAHAGILRLS